MDLRDHHANRRRCDGATLLSVNGEAFDSLAGHCHHFGHGCVGCAFVCRIAGRSRAGFYSADIELAIIAIELYRIVDTPLLVALPLFTFSGFAECEANTSTRLVNLMQSLFGWLPSVWQLSPFCLCSVYGAHRCVGVTIVALGALLLPALKQAGFGDKYSLGLVTTSGSLGLLLVPSVPLILYGVIATA